MEDVDSEKQKPLPFHFQTPAAATAVVPHGSSRPRSRTPPPQTVAQVPDRFRIGPRHYAYVYTATSLTVNGKPAYRCTRGRDEQPGKLYLVYQTHPGPHWQAVQVAGTPPTTGDAILRRGSPAFRSAFGADVRQQGSHTWQCWNDQDNSWWPGSDFHTQPL